MNAFTHPHLYIGIAVNYKGLNIAEWLRLNEHCMVHITIGSRASVGDSCIWWNEL